MSIFNLNGKVAIVTGAGTGLGRGMAIALGEAGADVVGIYNSTKPDLQNEFNNLGRKCLEIKADLFSIEPIQAIVDKTINVFGKINILVNNAGIIRRADSIDFTEKDWDDVVDINMKTVFFFSQAVAKEFIKSGNGGKIINIASMLSFQGGIRVPSYTASKSGVMGLTKILANEWAKYNVQVNGIAPGYMATDNTEALRADETRNKEIINRIPTGRWGNPEDLKGPIVFLASDASNYVNGHTLAVDGGWLAR